MNCCNTPYKGATTIGAHRWKLHFSVSFCVCVCVLLNAFGTWLCCVRLCLLAIPSMTGTDAFEIAASNVLGVSVSFTHTQSTSCPTTLLEGWSWRAAAAGNRNRFRTPHIVGSLPIQIQGYCTLQCTQQKPQLRFARKGFSSILHLFCYRKLSPTSKQCLLLWTLFGLPLAQTKRFYFNWFSVHFWWPMSVLHI